MTKITIFMVEKTVSNGHTNGENLVEGAEWISFLHETAELQETKGPMFIHYPMAIWPFTLNRPNDSRPSKSTPKSYKLNLKLSNPT